MCASWYIFHSLVHQLIVELFSCEGISRFYSTTRNTAYFRAQSYFKILVTYTFSLLKLICVFARAILNH